MPGWLRQGASAAGRWRRLASKPTGDWSLLGRAALRMAFVRAGVWVLPVRSLLGLLEGRGYVRGWALTPKGERLRRVYNEMDLVLAESLAERLFTGLDGPETAALASGFTFEARRAETVAGWPREIAEPGGRIEELWHEIAAAERQAGVPETRPPDPGFATLAMRWVAGENLAQLFEDEESSVGDFVRNCRQLIDLLRQIQDVEEAAPEGIRAALRGLDRGVVAAQGAL